MPKTKTVPPASLVLDFTVYPRERVDEQTIAYMREALAAGATFPPIVVDRASNRIADGVHRYEMYRRSGVEEVEVEFRDYADEAAFMLDAVRLNACHGRRLTTQDRVRCILHLSEHGIEPEQIASALAITCEKLGALSASRVGRLRSTNERVPLKAAAEHLAGKSLTKSQYEAHRHLGGRNQVWLVGQVITLLEGGLLDFDNPRLLDRLTRLQELLEAALEKAGVPA